MQAWGRHDPTGMTAGRLLGGLGYGAMAAGMLLGPPLLTRSWSPDSPGESSTMGPVEPRTIDRVIAVEGLASNGFTGLATELASRTNTPSWEEVRGLMERRGCTEMLYALRIRCLMSDGRIDELTNVRRPYHEPQHADEFVRYLRNGPDAAFWSGPGPPPWKSAPQVGEGGAQPTPATDAADPRAEVPGTP